MRLQIATAMFVAGSLVSATCPMSAETRESDVVWHTFDKGSAKNFASKPFKGVWSVRVNGQEFQVRVKSPCAEAWGTGGFRNQLKKQPCEVTFILPEEGVFKFWLQIERVKSDEYLTDFSEDPELIEEPDTNKKRLIWWSNKQSITTVKEAGDYGTGVIYWVGPNETLSFTIDGPANSALAITKFAITPMKWK